jgi:hypothetical protein
LEEQRQRLNDERRVPGFKRPSYAAGNPKPIYPKTSRRAEEEGTVNKGDCHAR